MKNLNDDYAIAEFWIESNVNPTDDMFLVDTPEQEELEEVIQEAIQKHIEENLTLEMVEEYAEYHDLISSEDQLSKQFDYMVQELIDCDQSIDVDDTPMMSEWFSNWVDSLCKEGEIHSLQYSNYCYVGKYS